MIKKVLRVIKKELMLTLSLAAAAVSLFITPPSAKLLEDIDWRTLGILFMMLTVLEGFKRERVLSPIVRLGERFGRMTSVTLFLVFGVFFTSMFVTNDVSLIIFVPLTIMIFKSGGKEKYILPVITFENIAAIRGSLLTPFGSPQNLFLYGKSGVGVWRFILHMLPLCAMSAALLVVFIFILYRRDLKEELGRRDVSDDESLSEKPRAAKRAAYLLLFAIVVAVIVTRTSLWYFAVILVALAVALIDVKLFLKVDYVLLATFLCFFIFSSSIASNGAIASALKGAVSGREYWWAIGSSQIISNVPATIVLYPFSTNFAGLIYGADTAGLCSLIGSLASVINYRIYVREYPGKGWSFIKTFTLISLAFFAVVVVPGYLLSFWSFF
ncbi:MAG: sodium:proton antiporter [Clostridia bacterium]|nr:sodium:proton antiporter [Clostridia bacterium]